jgi:hypothetical protein
MSEKSPTNTKVIGTKTGAVPWPITLVFPELKKTHSLLDCIHPVIVLRNLYALLVPSPVLSPMPTPMPTDRPPLPPSSYHRPRRHCCHRLCPPSSPPPCLHCSTKKKSIPPPPSPRGCCRDDATQRGYACDPWDVHGLVLERPHIDCWVPESTTTKTNTQPPLQPSLIVVPLP